MGKSWEHLGKMEEVLGKPWENGSLRSDISMEQDNFEEVNQLQVSISAVKLLEGSQGSNLLAVIGGTSTHHIYKAYVFRAEFQGISQEDIMI